MDNIDKTETIGKIVAAHPNTVDVLNKYKIDFSFKGNTTLEEAIREKNLKEYDVVGEMDLAVDEFKLMNSKVIYWENEPLDKILDFIEGHHHVFMTETLRKIDSLIEKNTAEIPLELKVLFAQLKTDMVDHQKKEEDNLFTLLREYSRNKSTDLRHEIVKYMIETEGEHDEAGRLFNEINTMTNDFTIPPGAPGALRKVYTLLDELEKETFIHIHMENSILFKMI